MKPITSKAIERASEYIDNLEDDGIEKLMQIFIEQQPGMVAYLMVSGEEDFMTEDSQQYLIYLGLKIWYAIYSSGVKSPVLNDDDILEIEEKNMVMLEYFDGSTESQFAEEVELMVAHHPQMELMRYAVFNIMSMDEEEELDINEDCLGFLFICLKTFIEAFNKY